MDYNHKINKYFSKNNIPYIKNLNITDKKETYKLLKTHYLHQNGGVIPQNEFNNLYRVHLHGHINKQTFVVPDNVILLIPACIGSTILVKTKDYALNTHGLARIDSIKKIKDLIEQQNKKILFIGENYYKIYLPKETVPDIDLAPDSYKIQYGIYKFIRGNENKFLLDINQFKNKCTTSIYPYTYTYTDKISGTKTENIQHRKLLNFDINAEYTLNNI